MNVNCRARFLACMNYTSEFPRPNHEAGSWPQTRVRWAAEAPRAVAGFHWRWFDGEAALGMDRRLFIPLNAGYIPPFEAETLEEDDRYVTRRSAKGIVTRALKEGAIGGGRMCMDEYVGFPVEKPEDFADIRRRMELRLDERYLWPIEEAREKADDLDAPVILGRNCDLTGFYWRAREFMGTEGLCYAWYDYPDLMHEMMAFLGDYLIELCRPMVAALDIDYVCINEDMSMKGGPLLSPETYKTFIFPHMKRLADMLRSHGVRHICVDTDGDPTRLMPLLMDAGVDALWPLERASDVDPNVYRAKFGRGLRLWGGVDKRELAKGPAAIRAHLATLIPLIEEGGFIPTVDHTVPPDVSWDNFKHYWELKQHLLAGAFAKLR